ncbi:hypothetical protein EC12741_3389 [Escherichia coli 1.2741]|nr:hypothetical protein ECSTEC7V_4578 [Escherichia coli STEC_7v]EIG80922.1 hypothetical protein EC12741_3389 [Escherichia coli 1.2741]
MPDAEKVVGLIRRDQRRIRHHAQMPDAGCGVNALSGLQKQ